ncbi:MAG: hypothetical protein KDJ52_28525 [Anaerolineae bacterium]|nr:hypothetical protein [Anaerolineae bacterium]
MADDVEVKAAEQDGRFGSCLLWFVWGISLSFTTILALVMMALLAISIALNAYLSWQLAGLQVSITRKNDTQLEIPASIPSSFLVAVPTQTPLSAPPSGVGSAPTPISTGAPVAAVPADSEIMTQFATLAAIATQSAASSANSSAAPVQINPPVALNVPTATPAVLPASGIGSTPVPIISPTSIPPAVAIGEPAVERESSIQEANAIQSETNTAAPSASDSRQEAHDVNARTAADQSAAETFSPPSSSSNTYTLIPLDGERDKRPAAEHGDLNLSLRDPQPIDEEKTLKDVGAGIDPGAPNLGAVFSGNIVQTYGIHNWDWGCNCAGDLIKDGSAILVGVETTPGEPIFIPPTGAAIYDGKYYAVVLYASEDSLTFAYTRDGTVAQGYAVHYKGLSVDPNLLATYNKATGNDVIGLTLDTPVGVAASNELIIAIRDKGTFMDARSINDWWKK